MENSKCFSIFYMPYSLNQLSDLYANIFGQKVKDRPIPTIEVQFYPYTGLHHTIRIRSNKVFVRLSDLIVDAPIEIHRALAFILISKLLRRKVPIAHEETYRQFSYSPDVLRRIELSHRGRGKKIISSARGEVYDLEKMFRQLNYKYFEGSLKKPTLTWSQRKTHRILGHHDSFHETIVISKTLDSHDVPEWLVEYVLYHEMLHIKHGSQIVNNRRQHHTKAFRTDEKKFPYYEQAQVLIEELVRQQRKAHKRKA